MEHVYKPNNHCERCGQTPWDPELGIDNMMFGRHKECLSDQQLEDMKTYCRAYADKLEEAFPKGEDYYKRFILGEWEGPSPEK